MSSREHVASSETKDCRMSLLQWQPGSGTVRAWGRGSNSGTDWSARVLSGSSITSGHNTSCLRMTASLVRWVAVPWACS